MSTGLHLCRPYHEQSLCSRQVLHHRLRRPEHCGPLRDPAAGKSVPQHPEDVRKHVHGVYVPEEHVSRPDIPQHRGPCGVAVLLLWKGCSDGWQELAGHRVGLEHAVEGCSEVHPMMLRCLFIYRPFSQIKHAASSQIQVVCSGMSASRAATAGTLRLSNRIQCH